MSSTGNSSPSSRWRDHGVAIAYTVIGGLLFMGSAPLWFTALREHVLPAWMGGTAEIDDLSGGCAEGWQVFAQNRYTPVGTAVRTHPNVDAEKVDSISPNIPFTVDGWAHASVAYEHNSPPFDSDVWLHLENDEGWVSFAGVRATPTAFDPTGYAEDGGLPAPLPTDCEGTVE